MKLAAGLKYWPPPLLTKKSNLPNLDTVVDISFCTWIKWAASWQNQQNGMCAQRRLRSAWASAQSDQSLLCTQWVAMDPSFLHADSEDSDQTGQVPRLIWVFAGRTCHCAGFVMRWLKSSDIYSSSCALLRIEPRHEKTCLQGFRPGKTQTGLLSHRS